MGLGWRLPTNILCDLWFHQLSPSAPALCHSKHSPGIDSLLWSAPWLPLSAHSTKRNPSCFRTPVLLIFVWSSLWPPRPLGQDSPRTDCAHHPSTHLPDLMLLKVGPEAWWLTLKTLHESQTTSRKAVTTHPARGRDNLLTLSDRGGRSSDIYTAITAARWQLGEVGFTTELSSGNMEATELAFSKNDHRGTGEHASRLSGHKYKTALVPHGSQVCVSSVFALQYFTLVVSWNKNQILIVQALAIKQPCFILIM